MTRQLGMGTQCPFETRSKWGNVSATVNSLGDLRYFVWMVGTVLTDMVCGRVGKESPVGNFLRQIQPHSKLLAIPFSSHCLSNGIETQCFAWENA